MENENWVLGSASNGGTQLMFTCGSLILRVVILGLAPRENLHTFQEIAPAALGGLLISIGILALLFSSQVSLEINPRSKKITRTSVTRKLSNAFDFSFHNEKVKKTSSAFQRDLMVLCYSYK